MCQSKEVWKHWEMYQELFVNEVQRKKVKGLISISSFPCFSSQVLQVVQLFFFAPGTFLNYEGFIESLE